MSVLYIRNKDTGKFEPVTTIQGARGPTGYVDGLDYWEDAPKKCGTASPGTSELVPRGDHVHPMPTAQDVGAIPHENFVHNSDFTRFIAQAGIGGLHGTQAYAGDRWILDSGSVTGVANGGAFTEITLNGTIRQKIENPPGTGTVILEMIDGEAEASYAGGELTITSSGGILKNVRLYEGEMQSEPLPYVSRGMAAELMECQRFCTVIPGWVHFRAATVTTNQIWATVHLPIVPNNSSMTPAFNDAGFVVRDMNNKDVEGFTFSVVALGGYLRFVAAKSSHGMTDAVIRTTAPIIVSFDL